MHSNDLSMDNHSPPTAVQAVALETLVANLRNAHALEKQVIAVLEPQLSLLDDYPDLHVKITQHIAETHEQADRLQTALEACGSSTSMVKDALLSVMGLSQSSVQGFSSDGVLKAVVADMMTEHLEIATYRTLIVLAELAGRHDICPALETSLREEAAMADWFNQNLEQLTRRFVEVEAAEDRQADANAIHTMHGSSDSQVPWTQPHDASADRNPAGHAISDPHSSSVNGTVTPNAQDRGMRQPPPFGKGPSDV